MRCKIGRIQRGKETLWCVADVVYCLWWRKKFNLGRDDQKWRLR